MLAFGVQDASLKVVRLGTEDEGEARFEKLLGHTVRTPVAALATALDCPRHEVLAVLRARGDEDLAAMLEQ